MGLERGREIAHQAKGAVNGQQGRAQNDYCQQNHSHGSALDDPVQSLHTLGQMPLPFLIVAPAGTRAEQAHIGKMHQHKDQRRNRHRQPGPVKPGKGKSPLIRARTHKAVDYGPHGHQQLNSANGDRDIQPQLAPLLFGKRGRGRARLPFFRTIARRGFVLRLAGVRAVHSRILKVLTHTLTSAASFYGIPRGTPGYSPAANTLRAALRPHF